MIYCDFFLVFFFNAYIIGISYNIIIEYMSSGEEKKVPVVNETCIGCGACVAICGEVFDLNDEGMAFAKQGKDSSNSEGIDDAINACPVNAIHYKD